MRKQKIRHEEHVMKLKNQELERKKRHEARIEIERKIAEEEHIIKQKEQEVMQMELLEMELIKKL